MNKENLTVLTDSYKVLHHAMYPSDTQTVYSYFEARVGATFNKTVFFGLQYLIKEYLVKGITKKDIDEGEELVVAHLGSAEYFNREMWEHILRVHGGRLPLRIMAVPEGTPVDINNVMMTVENTDPRCAPLTNHFESLLTHVWGPSTVASLSREVKILLNYYLEATGGNMGALNFMLHDFGFRGVNQCEAAGIAGAGHIVNFMGTDTIAAMQYAREYYDAPINGLAYSVPASEHSVMTARGESGEKAVFKQMLDRFPKGILSVVIDSYNYRRFIDEYAKEFKDQILARDGKVVFRPDSGDPDSVTIDVLEGLDTVFGSTKNAKGYRQLNPKVGTLWGDGIDYNGIRGILYTMRNNHWCADNIVFGMGGGFLQKINRDTQRFAFKSSAQQRSDVWYDIQKNPLDTSKKSKSGRLILTSNNGQFETIRVEEATESTVNRLKPVFVNGLMVNEITFDQVRANAAL